MKDTDILNTAYQLRCLTREQIIRTFFPNDEHKENRNNTYADKVLRGLIKDGYLEKRKLLSKTYYQTTTKGYSLLKKQDIDFIGSGNAAFDEFKPNSRIQLRDKQLSHQEHLNNFPLNLIRRNPPLVWTYRDDMFVNKEFRGQLHPDGVLECENECFFLEMDMGTETPKQLRDKWLRYRKLIATGNIRTWDSVTVLFLQKPTRSPHRKETIINTIQDTISDLTDGVNFDIRIGSESELFEWFCNEMERKYITGNNREFKDILEGQGYKVSSAKELDTGRTHPRYYIRREQDGKIADDNGIADEFLLDINTCQPQSIILNTMLFEEMQLEFNNSNGRKIRYVILEDSEGECSKFLKDEAGNRDGILFTTSKRLKEKSGAERFYKIIQGVKYHFNNSYTRMIVEEEI